MRARFLAAGLAVAVLGVATTDAQAIVPGWECVPATIGQAVVSGGTGSAPSCAAGTTAVLAPTYVSSGVGGKPTVEFAAVNVQVVNGTGSETTLNGSGNLVVGYDEKPGVQTGSHNLLLGGSNAYSSYGGLVAGTSNSIAGAYSSVLGGAKNVVSGASGAILGGFANRAASIYATVGGGCSNLAGTGAVSANANCTDTASFPHAFASVQGGVANQAAGPAASVAGGEFDLAAGPFDATLGGFENHATGTDSTVSGGDSNEARGN